MTRRGRRVTIVIVSLSLISCAAWCFYWAVQYLNPGMWYVAVVSSNPNPPESAKVMARYWMDKSTNWFWLGMGFVMLSIIWLIVAFVWAKRHRLNQEQSD